MFFFFGNCCSPFSPPVSACCLQRPLSQPSPKGLLLPLDSRYGCLYNGGFKHVPFGFHIPIRPWNSRVWVCVTPLNTWWGSLTALLLSGQVSKTHSCRSLGTHDLEPSTLTNCPMREYGVCHGQSMTSIEWQQQHHSGSDQAGCYSQSSPSRFLHQSSRER